MNLPASLMFICYKGMYYNLHRLTMESIMIPAVFLVPPYSRAWFIRESKMCFRTKACCLVRGDSTRPTEIPSQYLDSISPGTTFPGADRIKYCDGKSYQLMWADPLPLGIEPSYLAMRWC